MTPRRGAVAFGRLGVAWLLLEPRVVLTRREPSPTAPIKEKCWLCFKLLAGPGLGGAGELANVREEWIVEHATEEPQ